MDRLKVTHVITDLGTGGAQQMLVNLLSATDRSRVDADVVSLGTTMPMGARIEALDIPVRSLNLRRGRLNALGAPKLAAWLRSRGTDVVHGWLTHANLAAGVAAPLAGRPAVVWSLHTSSPSRPDLRMTTRWAIAACRVLASRLPSRIVSCSETGALAHIKAGYPAARTTVIPNACDTERFVPSPANRVSVREELGVPGDALLIGHVARFHPVKDHATSVAAMGLLHQQYPEARFVLCGEGVRRENETLIRRIRDAGIERQCHLLGRRDDMARLVSAFDVATSTSGHGEACPLVLIEAMSCGVPCVSTDVGDASLILDGTGIVVPPRSASALAEGWSMLIEAGQDGRSKLGNAARTRILTHYGLRAVAQQYEQLYGSVKPRRRTAFATAARAADSRGYLDTRLEPKATSSAPGATHRVE